MRIAALATGASNVRSVVRALEQVVTHATITVTADPALVRAADVLVVPGQGSFGAFADALDESGLGDVLRERIAAGTPYLGICLGLQVLFEASDEAPGRPGLGVLAGHVRRLEAGVDPEGRARTLPHAGWNEVRPVDGSAPRHFYFAHTFAAVPEDPSVVHATTEYGSTFASAVTSGRILGVQFHPEKSQRAGLDLLAHFFGTL